MLRGMKKPNYSRNIAMPRRLWRTGLVLAFSAIVHTATAGVFSVTPVRIYMTPRDRAVAVTITNEGDTPVVLQADLNNWSQKADGTDELTLTEDLILAPPIIKLAPKAKQVVRLALLKPADASRQLTYRMILREIPEALASQDKVQVPIALALSMPVFITPPPAARKISCTPQRDGQTITIQCANSGSAYAQVREILLKRGENVEARFEGGVYILPGARKPHPLKADRAIAAGAAQLVVAYDDATTQSFDVMIP
jgi:fimbrial chaperone protein